MLRQKKHSVKELKVSGARDLNKEDLEFLFNKKGIRIKNKLKYQENLMN